MTYNHVKDETKAIDQVISLPLKKKRIRQFKTVHAFHAPIVTTLRNEPRQIRASKEFALISSRHRVLYRKVIIMTC